MKNYVTATMVSHYLSPPLSVLPTPLHLRFDIRWYCVHLSISLRLLT